MAWLRSLKLKFSFKHAIAQTQPSASSTQSVANAKPSATTNRGMINALLARPVSTRWVISTQLASNDGAPLAYFDKTAGDRSRLHDNPTQPFNDQ